MAGRVCGVPGNEVFPTFLLASFSPRQSSWKAGCLQLLMGQLFQRAVPRAIHMTGCSKTPSSCPLEGKEKQDATAQIRSISDFIFPEKMGNVGERALGSASPEISTESQPPELNFKSMYVCMICLSWVGRNMNPWTHAMAHVCKLEDSLQELVLSFRYVGP